MRRACRANERLAYDHGSQDGCQPNSRDGCATKTSFFDETQHRRQSSIDDSRIFFCQLFYPNAKLYEASSIALVHIFVCFIRFSVDAGAQ